jgi:hypothetical protein
MVVHALAKPAVVAVVLQALVVMAKTVVMQLTEAAAVAAVAPAEAVLPELTRLQETTVPAEALDLREQPEVPRAMQVRLDLVVVVVLKTPAPAAPVARERTSLSLLDLVVEPEVGVVIEVAEMADSMVVVQEAAPLRSAEPERKA